MIIGGHREPLAEAGFYVLIVFSTFVALYFVYFGYVLTRLWYYEGDLGPKFKKYLILPPHIKKELEREEEERAKHGDASAEPNKVLNPKRWTLQPQVVDLNKEEEEVSDEEERQALKEEKRISRMPFFVQDDCGDGRQFPDVPAVDPNVYTTRTISGCFAPPNYVEMGVTKHEVTDWLTVDNTYGELQKAKLKVLSRKPKEVTFVTKDAEASCTELMDHVVGFLTNRYPDKFKEHIRFPNRKTVKNKLTKESFALQRPYDVSPLKVCARLAMEDFHILKRSDFSGEYYLIAAATAFPSGWKLSDRIGKSVIDLQGPLPLWKNLPEILNTASHLSPDSEVCIARHSTFIQINPDDRPLHKLLFIQEGKDFFPGSFSNMVPQNLVVRREFQTFRPLPVSGSIVWTIKTTVDRLCDIPESDRAGLAKEIKSWPQDVATYKGRDLWQRAVITFLEGENGDGYLSDVDL